MNEKYNFMLNLFKPRLGNAVSVLQLLLKALNVKVSYSTIKKTLEDHPDYLSIMAISDSLTEWLVQNDTYTISDHDYPHELLYPFIAHSKANGGNFLLIQNISNGKVTYSNEKVNGGIMLEQEFLEIWSKVALHAEPAEESGEVNYTQNRFKELLRLLIAPIAILTLAITLYLSFANQVINWPICGLTLLKLGGISVSMLLLMQSVNADNPFIKNLCSLGGKNDCNDILKSDAAKVTGWLSWSEVGFFYFMGSFLSLLLAPSSLVILAWLNLFVLPYTIYSISYQYRNKNWCILCCTVQVLLILEAITFLSTQNYKLSNFPSFGLLLTLVSFTLPILIWAFLKPFFVDASQIKALKQQLKKFKYNSNLFNQALMSQPKYSIGNELMPIKLGNPESETIITLVSNPFCEPCAKAHQTIDAWLKFRDDIQLKVIFTTANEESDPRTKVSRHLSALSTHENKNMVENAMNDWYNSSSKNYEEWALKYPAVMTKEIAMVTQYQKAWCDLAEIKFTPTILVNGYKLPEPYRLEDIKHLLS